MRGISNLDTRQMALPSYHVDALQWGALTTEAKKNVRRCVTYPNAIILEDTNFPVRDCQKCMDQVIRRAGKTQTRMQVAVPYCRA